MQLTTQPVTEQEYWAAIEGLGSFIWTMEHGMSRGQIPSEPGVIQDVVEARKISKQLATEISEKFNVIPIQEYPEGANRFNAPAAPEGKIYYWDWYDKQKTSWLTSEYEKCICKACPYSKGLSVFLSLQQHPCSQTSFSGNSGELSRCVMVDLFHDWTRDQLLENIREKAGNEGLAAFLANETEVKAAAIQAV